MGRLGWKQLSLALAVVASTGCAGVYAEAGLTTLPTASYSRSAGQPTGHETARGDVVQGATAFNIGLGVDFDIKREKRVEVGYDFMAASYGKDASGTFGAVNARYDFNLIDLSENWKLRAGGGVQIGTGTGSTTLPGQSGAPMTRADVTGGGVLAGIGLSYYATPHLGFHLLAAPTYQTIAAPQGRIGGFGATAKLTAVLTAGDSRPDAVVQEPLWSQKNIMPAIAAAARDVLCTATEMNRESWAGVLVRCPDDKRDIFFFQTPNSVTITCEHSSQDDCRARMRQFIDATKKKFQ